MRICQRVDVRISEYEIVASICNIVYHVWMDTKIFHNLDKMRAELAALDNDAGKVSLNRLYVDASGESINFTYAGKKYLLVCEKGGRLYMAVAKSNGSSKYDITYQDVRSGTFVEHCK